MKKYRLIHIVGNFFLKFKFRFIRLNYVISDNFYSRIFSIPNKVILKSLQRSHYDDIVPKSSYDVKDVKISIKMSKSHLKTYKDVL